MPSTKHDRVAPRVLERPEHSVSRSAISTNALKVLYRLHKGGFISYLVGGAVRDLLLGRTPKDFDVGTNARPQQVRQLFRNAWVIGRRFRLVLVKFDRETVEVATFRRSPEPPDMEDGETLDALAPVVESAEFGSPEEDAWRRDFTVNGLFYSIADFSVIDYVGGLADLERGVIRTIGEARQRFAEDPVRMMRAVEYGARLGFALAPEIEEATALLHGEIRRAAPARIAYELVESLKCGHAAAVFGGLDRSGLLSHILPEVGQARQDRQAPELGRLLSWADQAAGTGRALKEESMLGLVLLPGVWSALLKALEGAIGASELERAIRDLLDPPTLRLALSNFRGHLLRSSFFLLGRMLTAQRSAKSLLRMTRNEAFPVALELAQALAGTDDRLRAAYERFSGARAKVEAGQSLESGSASGEKRRRNRRRRGGRRRANPEVVQVEGPV